MRNYGITCGDIPNFRAPIWVAVVGVDTLDVPAVEALVDPGTCANTPVPTRAIDDRPYAQT